MTNTIQPGPEMDAAVAAAVGIDGQISGSTTQPDGRFFWATNPDTGALYEWRPSRDVADAIEALEAGGFAFSMRRDKMDRVELTIWRDGLVKPRMISAPSIPEAVCRAILSWAKAEGSES